LNFIHTEYHRLINGLKELTMSSVGLSFVVSSWQSAISPWSTENLRNAILSAISIAVDPLSEKYAREAQPAQQMIQLLCKELKTAC